MANNTTNTLNILILPMCGTSPVYKMDAVSRCCSPILIIPGFMSSALEVVESDFTPRWKGERLWLKGKRSNFEEDHWILI